jgi:hypothetical protein
MDYYSPIKKNEILKFTAIWVSIEDAVFIESKSVTARQMPHVFTHIQNLKKLILKCLLEALLLGTKYI